MVESIRTQAVLLRSVDFRETDRIVTLFTLQHGRLSAVARGARNSRRRFAGALEPFCVVETVLQEGRSGLYRLDEARVLTSFRGLLSDLKRMEETGRCLEAVRSFSPEHAPEPNLFHEIVEMLAAIDSRPIDRLTRIRICFLVRLLHLSGLGAELSQCGLCGKKPAEGQAARFDPTRGHLVCRACGGAAFVLGSSARNAWIAAADGGVEVEPQLALTDADVQQIDAVLPTLMRAHAPAGR